MKVIELFSGNADITKALKLNGIQCVSVDYDQTKKPDIVANVYALTPDFLKNFDFIWASPDCTTYSLASHGKHRKSGGIPVSEYAKECDLNNARFIKMLIDLDIPFIIENPRGHFRNMAFARDLNRITVYYAQYGAPYSKPTDLFSNRNLDGLFDTTRKITHTHLDYCTSYDNFLGRCKIPDKLIDNIVLTIKKLLEN